MNDVSPERVEELVSQAEQFDADAFYAAVTILAQDIDQDLQSRRAPGAPVFQQIYDTVTNEERMIRDARGPEFHPVGNADIPTGIAAEIADGQRELGSLISDAVDESSIEEAIKHNQASERTKQVGERLLRRFAAACKSEICKDRPDLFQASSQLNRTSLAAMLTPVITSVLAGTLTLSLFAPLAVLVALFIVDVGIDIYCSSESTSPEITEEGTNN